MFNLICNATKFTNKGYVKIVVSWIQAEQFKESMLTPSQIDYSMDEFADNYYSLQNHETFRNHDFHNTMNTHCVQALRHPFSACPDLQIHTKQQAKTIVSEVIPAQINVSLCQSFKKESESGFLKLEVMDSGSGMSKEVLAKLFQKSSQVTTHPTQKRLGTGMGLWITNHLCRRMGGGIKGFSKLNLGSTFVAVIKCHATPCAEKSEITSQSVVHPIISTGVLNSPSSLQYRQKSDGFKVMVVDDNLANQHYIKAVLQKLSVNVVDTAVNGLQAFEKYILRGNCFFDFVFMDVEMPVMDGITASEKIRVFERENQWRPVTLVIVTANCNKDTFQSCLDKDGPVKADYVYGKPFTFNDCKNLIEEYTNFVEKKNTTLLTSPNRNNLRVLQAVNEFASHNSKFVKAGADSRITHMLLK